MRWTRVKDFLASRRGRLFIMAGAVALAGAFAAWRLWPAAEAEPESIASVTRDPAAVSVLVDQGVTPALSTVPPLEGETEPRRVARSLVGDVASDFVIGEIVLFVPDYEALEALEERDDVEVVAFDDTMFHDFGSGDPDAVIEVLVRIVDLAAVDTSNVSWDLEAVEPGLEGTVHLSDGDALATVALLASLAAAHGLDVAFNDVPFFDTIPAGSAIEHDGEDAFDWTYVASLAVQEIGLDTAWQMLYHHGRQLERVRVLVVDSGFTPNGDFPAESKIRKGEWGPVPDTPCGPQGEHRCPNHGTHVVGTVVARVDNGFGVAGVAGPFAELIAMPMQGDTFSTTRALRQVIREEQPHVINMSFTNHHTKLTNTMRNRWDRTLRWAEERHGVISFAAAGNQGIDVDQVPQVILPCTSNRAVCVGGLMTDSTTWHPGSNFGSERSSRSVQIYGPMCVWSYADPDDPTSAGLREVCGTSFASPFVAGVAALVRVADPSLSPSEIRSILFDTAHVGVGNAPGTGWVRRVNAHAAVARALGTTWMPPTITVTAGEGSFPVGDVFTMSAEGRSYTGEHLALNWHSSIDGWLTEAPTMSPVSGSGLSPGEHLIQITTVPDRRGMGGTASFAVTVEHLEPLVSIVSPQPDDVIYEGFAVQLVGFADDPNPFGAAVELTGGWTVRDASGVVVWSTSAFPMAATAPLAAGTYTIRFHATDPHGVTVDDTVVIEVRELEPGWSPPFLQILDPGPNAAFGVTPSQPLAEVRLRAQGWGTNGSPIAGERFRWTATNNHGDEVVLCVGSAFPGTGGGGDNGFGLVQPQSCADVIVDLGVGSGGPLTVWSLRLDAVDVNNVPVAAVASLTVTLIVQ